MKTCRICKKEITAKGVTLHGYVVHAACKERYLRQQVKREIREGKDAD